MSDSKKITRTAIVTGGSSGIGLAIARRLIQEGYRVGLVARRSDRLGKAASGLAGDTVWRSADLGARAQTQAAISELARELAGIDVLVNSAGSNKPVRADSPLEEAEHAWDDVLAANLKSTFLASMVALAYLRRPGGRIINIGSIAARSGSSRPGGLAYAAAKAGVQGLTASLARELAADGITVNTVAPGLIAETEFFGEAGLPSARLAEIVNEIPVGRPGIPADVAAAVAWLAGDEASFITGATLPVNGGWRIG